MPNFSYVARSADGIRVTGSLIAATERDVVNSLSKKLLFPISVEVEKAALKVSFGGRVSEQRIATFYSQLASL